VTVSDAGVASTYRQREAAVLDSSITDVTLATTKANALLDGSASEIVEIEGLEIVCSAAHVNDIRPGQRVQIKLTRHNIDAYAYYRVVRRTVQPMQNTTHYLVALGLADNVLASANGERGGDEIWPQKSNANDDGATVIVDRSGINIIDGAITVVNSSATVIIDGESDIFKIAAEGTQSVSVVTLFAQASTTLSGLGTWTDCPAALLIHSDNNTSTNPQGVVIMQGYAARWAAATSGGAVTSEFTAMKQYVNGTMELNGSSEAVVKLNAWNSDDTGTYYQKYFVLQETAF